MKVQHVNGSALVVRWARPEVTYHPPILHFLVSYSWTAHDDSYEETHLTEANHKLEAIISPVSPDVLYLFRVQAVCMNDMRSDFSQSMLFRGYLCELISTAAGEANTTRIFEGTRIVKTGMPTVSPASSADMAPISSGSSTWTSSGIPFSFVSMATGIGPSSSGSQATVASVVTSTLLAGLGFSGGVISSFPSSVWPSRAPTHSPTSTRQTTEPTKPAQERLPPSASVVKDSSEAGGEDRESSGGQGEDGEREGEDKDEEEEEDDKDEKKQRKGSRGAGEAGREDDSTAVDEPPAETQESTAKEKEQTGPNPTNMLPNVNRSDHPSAVTNLTHHARPGSGAGLGHVEWLIPLVVVSALTFLCLILLLAVLVYWRRAPGGRAQPEMADVGPPSSRLTTRRKVHEGPVQCGLGSSRGRGPRRPNPWNKTLAIGTWNVTSLGGKEPELVREVERYRLEIVGLTSTHGLGSGTQLLERGWTLHYSGVAQGERRRAGVGLLHSSPAQPPRVGVHSPR
ncbi:hypothetical protein L3Q82_007760 [Scortum barcoo]|uniref:Uncharacterized protein n=1 Tax=Scortum barcoo TaxID=214431 RepID=A0ACB8WNJ3_9TELE|nr:hypothetical protein L3Q82_007760 [Scortum barcoo]